MKTIKDLDINNKKVIIRCDYNVPIEDGKILDDTRIVKSLKTLEYVITRAKQTIILSHLGRIKEEQDKKDKSLKIVCEYLSKLINKEIGFCDYTNQEEIFNKYDIVMMENTRFFDLDNKKESNNDEELSKYFASLGEVFINDAFGVSHRSNASNVGITKYIPSTNGFLIEEEVNNLNKLLYDVEKPYTVIMGGAKVSDKISVIKNLINKVDYLLIGGGMAYTFLKSMNKEIGKSICEDESLSFASDLLKEYKDKIILIEDNYVDNNTIKSIEEMTSEDIGFDILLTIS